MLIYSFPDPQRAPRDAPLAYGGDLSAGRLLQAYQMGIFPWYSADEPILWWSPDPRFVLPPKDCVINHGLQRELVKPVWTVTFDQSFEKVMRACAEAPRKGQNGTWITDEMISAYTELHEKGFAHSVECWRGGELAGGLYGVSLGGVFFGESMFHWVDNASKVAFAHLVEKLIAWDFELIDCQMPTKHLATFGAHSISRSHFLQILEEAVRKPTRVGGWGESR